MQANPNDNILYNLQFNFFFFLDMISIRILCWADAVDFLSCLLASLIPSIDSLFVLHAFLLVCVPIVRTCARWFIAGFDLDIFVSFLSLCYIQVHEKERNNRKRNNETIVKKKKQTERERERDWIDRNTLTTNSKNEITTNIII